MTEPVGPEAGAFRLHVRQVLVEADASFSACGDVMEALSWVRFAAAHGLALPPAIGQWLAGAIDAYQGSDATMDEALGLKGKGPSNPRFGHRAKAAREAALADMAVLVAIGASAEEAADLVASLGHFKRRTLIEHFARSALKGEASSLSRGAALRRQDVERLLAPYPDRLGLVVTQAKRRIRFKHGI